MAEARTRNLPVPPEVLLALAGATPELSWPVTPDGWSYRSDGRAFSPNSPGQHGFLVTDARFSALFSGRGGGKSAAGAQRANKKIREGQSGIVMNPDFENLKISTWPEFREWIPWKLVVPKHKRYANPEWWPSGPFEIVFQNGVTVIIKGVQEPGSARGPNVNWLWYDEAGRDKTGDSWKVAFPSVRIGPNPQAWITTTPLGREHWTYKFFVKLDGIPEDLVNEYEKLTSYPLIEYFHTSIEDNKENLDPGFYLAVMAAYTTEWERQREVLGQFADEGGVLGDRGWFKDKILSVIPDDWIMRGRLRFWDLAATVRKIVAGRKLNDPDQTVGTLMADCRPNFVIEDQVAGHWIWEDIKRVIIQTAKMDGPFVRICIEQEPGSGGINQVAEIASRIRKELPGWPNVIGWKPEGDKVVKSGPLFSEAKQGKIFLLDGPWVEPFLDQFSSFPVAIHDDLVDSAASARHVIAPIKSWRNVEFLAIGKIKAKEPEKVSEAVTEPDLE